MCSSFRVVVGMKHSTDTFPMPCVLQSFNPTRSIDTIVIGQAFGAVPTPLQRKRSSLEYQPCQVTSIFQAAPAALLLSDPCCNTRSAFLDIAPAPVLAARNGLIHAHDQNRIKFLPLLCQCQRGGMTVSVRVRRNESEYKIMPCLMMGM